MDYSKVCDITRCPDCGQKLWSVNDYGDWAIFVKDKNGRLTRKSNQRWFDIDWVLSNHINSH